MKAIVIAVLAGLTTFGCSSAPTKKIDAPSIVKTAGVSEISAEEALPGIEAAYSQFIDVRNPEEYAAGHAYRAKNFPLETLAGNLYKLEKNEPVYIICRTDNRSREAAKVLVDAGFKQAIFIKGGMEAWEAAQLPTAK
jgi:rhodanese-related sulfurtransferase